MVLNKCVSWLGRRLGRKPALANSHCTQGTRREGRRQRRGPTSGGSQLVFLREFSFRDSHAWGRFTCNYYNSRALRPWRACFFIIAPPSFQPCQRGSSSSFREHTGILFPTDQTRVGGLGQPELQRLPPPGAPGSAGPGLRCFPAPDFQIRLRSLSLALRQKWRSADPSRSAR